jgi:phage-related protein
VTEDTHSGIKPVDWIGSSKKDLKGFPGSVVREIGVALMVAQYGGKHPSAKPMSGLGAGVLEIVENHDGDTYRAVYTVRFKSRIYVLHCFQKKSKRGVKTPKEDMDVVKARLKVARADHDERGE